MVNNKDEKTEEKTINCKLLIVNPLGEHVKDVPNEKGQDLTYGMVLGSILAEEKSEHFRPMKAWILSEKFVKNEKVALDVADLANLKKVVEASQRWFPFVLGQVLEYLEK